MSIIWSYSSLKTFQQCPRKYYHTKVIKDIKESDTDATLYGKRMHLVAEEYIRDGKPIPPEFNYLEPTLKILADIPGDKHCEVKLGLTSDFKACEFDAPDVWWHGIADLVIINNEKGLAHSVDYKTSKNARYADVKQLDLIAAGIFAKFPQIKKIKSALVFVVSNEIVKKKHEHTMKSLYLNSMEPELIRLEAAIKNDVWNPVSGPLCRYCPVTECAHNRKG